MNTMADTTWIMEETGDEKFPFRLSIRQGDKDLLVLRVQGKWPGQKGNIFCMAEEGREWPPPIHVAEQVPVTSLERFGKRISVVLDRARNKRCDFLFLTKQYKHREGEYEQIFWRTEKALKERRPRVKLSTYHSGELTIAIDKNERYAWSFSDCRIEKIRLPVGDYALRDEKGIAAVVERKTFDNMLSEFGRMPVFHQQLSELTTYRHSALVIEADYSDFFNPGRQQHYAPAFTSKAIAEIHAFHPGLTVVFAGNRKLAQEWTYRFFAAISSHDEDRPHQTISEAMEQYGEPPETRGGGYYEVMEKVSRDLPEEFTTAMVKAMLPTIAEPVIKRALREMQKKGSIISHGSGKSRMWVKRGEVI
ncbi:MAG: hypothetical protein HGA78_02070 [Nitrospirales bacterium]|nr:hypothetical protein [Nitrospirales bacterium]